MKETLSHRKIWWFFLISKIAYMFIAIYVYANFTSLGDTDRYISGLSIGSDDNPFTNSTAMLDFFAGNAAKILGIDLANLPFVFLSLFGLYYAISRINLNKKQLIFLLTLLSIPNIGIWTSIASKEAVAMFYMGVILGFTIDIIEKKKKNFILFFIALYLCYLFKKHYLIGMVSLITYVYMIRSIKVSAIGRLFATGFVFIAYIAIVYLLLDTLNETAYDLEKHFSSDAASTRPTIFLEDNDIIWKSPYGMVVSFIGPTLAESISKPTHLLAFIESTFILLMFFFFTFKLIYKFNGLFSKKDVFFFSIFIIPTAWFVFIHYPSGILNPGSAIRYRANFLPFLIILFQYIYLKLAIKNHYQINIKHNH